MVEREKKVDVSTCYIPYGTGEVKKNMKDERILGNKRLGRKNK